MKPPCRHTWLVGLFLLISLCGFGQTVDNEHDFLELHPDEEIEASDYNLFEMQRRSLVAYQRISGMHLPITFHFRGERQRQIYIGGMNLADGITTTSLNSDAHRMYYAYTPDTLAMTQTLYGREHHYLDPYTFDGATFAVRASGMVGMYSGAASVSHSLRSEHGTSYDLRIRHLFGPSIYNYGLHNHRSFASLALRRGAWSVLLASSSVSRHLQTATVAECYKLSGNPFYNSSCGLDNGKLRNAFQQKELLPIAVVSRSWQLDKTHISLSATSRLGFISRSGLNYYDATSPYPDHYAALPSGAGSTTLADQLRSEWRQNNPHVTGVDWDFLREQNRDGVARYVVASRIERVATLNLSSVATHRFSDATQAQFDLSFRYDNSAMYKRIDDLLGAVGALNIDYYNSDSEQGYIAFNNEENPYVLLRQGDRTGYNYHLDRLQGAANATLRHTTGYWTLTSSCHLAFQTLSRRGLWHKSTRSDSYGRSRWRTYPDCAAHFNATRQQGGSKLSFNGWVATVAPTYQQLFLSPRSSSAMVATKAIPMRYGASATLSISSDIVSAMGSVYVHRLRGDFQTSSYYDHVVGNYLNCELYDINTFTMGADMGLDIHVAHSHTLTTAIAWYYDSYTSNPHSNLYDDCTGGLLARGLKVELRGMHPARTPSFVAILGYNGWLPHNFLLSAELIYLDGRYIAPEPIYRMEHVTRLCTTDEHHNALTHQNRLGGALFLDARVGKMFYFGHHSLMISLSAQAHLAGDKTRYAYEQRRLQIEPDTHTYRQAPLKYTNSYPVSAMLSISYTL
ncbi:MAG: hypothetical protein E7128_03195 [Rikenellaceae bacterium]|nr:hypothetical protein [Rikenellaceae bacterium]